jgi:hypothetical protein
VVRDKFSILTSSDSNDVGYVRKKINQYVSDVPFRAAAKPPNQCPLYPRKRTLRSATGMSALCQQRTHAPQQSIRYLRLAHGGSEAKKAPAMMSQAPRLANAKARESGSRKGSPSTRASVKVAAAYMPIGNTIPHSPGS